MKLTHLKKSTVAILLAAAVLSSCGIITFRDTDGIKPAETTPEAEQLPPTDEPAEEPAESETETPPETEPETEAEPETVSTAAPETADAVREQRIAEELAQMSAREKLGQMFMAAYGSTSTAAMDEYRFGAYLLFASDFENETPEGIAVKMAELQSGSKYGVLTAVDEEGGTVTRVSRYKQYRATAFLSPRTLYEKGGLEAVRADTAEKAALLRSLGLNLNLAPVADISTNAGDFMYERSVGLDATQTAEYVQAVIEEAKAAGIASAVKHFPGYGSAADTHTGIVRDDRTYDELWGKDFVPFAAAIEEGVECVLVSHIIMAAIDEEKPASVSEKVAAVLRGELGYDGVILTDDLAMAGITDYCTTGNAALEAILAGYDMVCCTNWDTQYAAVWSAVEDGTITEERLNESAARILRMKYDMGLWS